MHMSGYPHIDKPWLKFYDKYNLELPKLNLVEYLKQKNTSRGNKIGEIYYGNTFTYDEIWNNSDIASRVLSSLGVGKGSRILSIVPNIPEAGFLWFGAIQLGAVTDFIDPRPDSMDLIANGKKTLEIVKHEKINFIIALDKCYLAMLKPIENELKEYGINDIIIVNTTDSMLKGKAEYMKDVMAYNELRNNRNVNSDIKKLKNYQAMLLKIKELNQFDMLLKDSIDKSVLNVRFYHDLVKECKNARFYNVSEFDLPMYIGHTSGTSGSRPKPIVLTNKNAISNLEQVINAKVAADEGDSALHILPFFAPFGAYDNYLLNIASGVSNIDIPEFEINEFGYLLKRHKPNSIMTTPAWISALPSYKFLDNADLSFIKKIIYGGDSMTAGEEITLNKWLKDHNCSVVTEKGYGMSEFAGCGTYARANYNKLESIGIPLCDTTYAIVDPEVDDKLVPLKFKDNEDRLFGELAISSDVVTSGKLDDQVIVAHYQLDGASYMRTRDLVEMDRDGIIYHKARKDLSFPRFDGYKIKPYEIEKVILDNKMVENVAVVSYYDDRQKGLMPRCNLVVKKSLNEEEKLALVKEIVYSQIIANPTTNSRQIPSKFIFRDRLPLTKNNKVDYNYLTKEQLDGNEVNVDVEQTNLTVENIHIYYEKINNKTKKRIK